MNILHVIDTLSMGGAENVLVGLAAEQKRLGHKVTVMPLVCSEQTPVRSKIENVGVCVHPFMEKGSVYNPYLIIKIAGAIRQFDIIHVHLFPALYWTAFASFLSFSNVPMVYTEHSTNNKRRHNSLLHFIDRWVYKHGYKKIIACSEKVLDTYIEAFPDIKHVCYINNGIDTKIYMNAEPYTKSELLGIAENCFVVTMVARFMSMKRQDTIVEAMEKLPEYVHVVFVGGNKKDEGLIRVKKLAEEKGIENRVHFLYIRTDVPQILKTSDAVVMASDYEGLSLSSIEGMAAGKPFIATNVNGLKEVVGGAGLLYENNNSDELAAYINMLSTDKEFYQQTADNCKHRALEYDIKSMVNSYTQVYKEVVKY